MTPLGSSPRARRGAPEPLSDPAAAVALRDAVDAGSLETDVRQLTDPAWDGRLRGEPGNDAARGYVISRLADAGLEPLFDGSWEQPTFDGDERYGTNAGALYRSADEDAGWIVLVAHYDHLGDGHLGADDNASSVAILLALGDALGRARPQLSRHVALVFPDSEEPPDIRTERMGSSWFWSHPPLPLDDLHLALVLDLMGGTAPDWAQAQGLGGDLYVLGAEASEGLADLCRGVTPEPGMEVVPTSVASIEIMPYVTWKRYARSDYHGLREQGGRPFVFLTTGRTDLYHTTDDTWDRLDFERMGRNTRFIARLVVHAAEGAEPLGWEDGRVDPAADARVLLRSFDALLADADAFPWLLARRLESDRDCTREILARSEAGEELDDGDYRRLQLASIRFQAAVWHPGGWWFAFW